MIRPSPFTMKLHSILLATLTVAACTTRSSEPAPATDTSLGRTVPPQSGNSHSTEIVKPPRAQDGKALTRVVLLKNANTERKLWISTDTVAEFEPTPQGRIALLQSDPSAIEVAQSQAGVRLWRVAAVAGTDTFSSNLSTGSARFSPVLHESNSAQSSMLALPGGVIATFPDAWDRSKIDGFVAARHLRVERALIEGQNTMLIPTGPGIESINIANLLTETDELVSCEPNFWRQAQTR